MDALFPEPSTADKVASVVHLIREAQDKAHKARRARDPETANYWLREMARLHGICRQVTNESQIDLFG